MKPSPHKVIFEQPAKERSRATVAITLYNYERHIGKAILSASRQDLRRIDLVVVDDASTDKSCAAAEAAIKSERSRFNRALLVRHELNSGLAAARNSGFSLAESDYVLVLDADNQIYPRCVSRCLEAAEAAGAEFAYPILEVFGDKRSLIGFQPWDVDLLARGNYIDALSLVKKSAWETVGGYSRMSVTGWEDFDFWCKFAERGFKGVQVPEILARYREHSDSMLRAITNVGRNAARVRTEIRNRHPWLYSTI